MGIGTTVNYTGVPLQGVPLAQKLAEPGVTSMDWIEATGVAPIIQGSEMAVAPMADTSTGALAPPIPGGLQMEKVVIVMEAQPLAVDLPRLLTAWSRLHIFLNFTMADEEYFNYG